MTQQAWSLPSTSRISFVLWDHSKMNQYGHPSPILSSAEEWVCMQLPFYLFLPSTTCLSHQPLRRLLATSLAKYFMKQFSAVCHLQLLHHSLAIPVASWNRLQDGRCTIVAWSVWRRQHVSSFCCYCKLSPYRSVIGRLSVKHNR